MLGDLSWKDAIVVDRGLFVSSRNTIPQLLNIQWMIYKAYFSKQISKLITSYEQYFILRLYSML